MIYPDEPGHLWRTRRHRAGAPRPLRTAEGVEQTLVRQHSLGAGRVAAQDVELTDEDPAMLATLPEQRVVA